MEHVYLVLCTFILELSGLFYANPYNFWLPFFISKHLKRKFKILRDSTFTIKMKNKKQLLIFNREPIILTNQSQSKILHKKDYTKSCCIRLPI